MESQRALKNHQKYLNLCSEDERRSYRFETTWWRVINDRIFLFGWAIPFKVLYTLRLTTTGNSFHNTTQQETPHTHTHTQAWCPFPKPELQLYSRSPARFIEHSQGQKKNMPHVVKILTQTVTLDIMWDVDLWQEIGPPRILTRNLGSVSSYCSAFKNKRTPDLKSWALKSAYTYIFHIEWLNDMNESLESRIYNTVNYTVHNFLASILSSDILSCHQQKHRPQQRYAECFIHWQRTFIIMLLPSVSIRPWSY